MDVNEYADFESQPSATLPAPTRHHIILKLELDMDPRVFRTVCVPSNYHFGHIHSLLQYSMGWGGGHLHGFDVHGPFETYKTNTKWHFRLGTVKKRGEHLVAMRATGSKPVPYRDFDNSQVYTEDQITVGEVWTRNNDHERFAAEIPKQYRYECDDVHMPMFQDMLRNLESLSNENIYVRYIYDFGDENVVAIKFDKFLDLQSPNSQLRVIGGQGGPPMEHSEESGSNCHKKRFDLNLFSKPENWNKYLTGQIFTVAGKGRVEIHERRQHSEARPPQSGIDHADNVGSVIASVEPVSQNGAGQSGEPRTTNEGSRKRTISNVQQGGGPAGGRENGSKRARYNEDDCADEDEVTIAEDGNDSDDGYDSHEDYHSDDNARSELGNRAEDQLPQELQRLGTAFQTLVTHAHANPTNMWTRLAVLAAAVAVTASVAAYVDLEERAARRRRER